MSKINKEKTTRLNIRSEAVEEILGHVPNWMIRWGNTLILLLVIGLFLLTYVIKYPDTLGDTVQLSTSRPPQNVYATVSGNFSRLNVTDGQMVQKDSALALIEDGMLKKEVIKTTIDGQLYFADFWKKNSMVIQGDLLFRIKPIDYGSYITILNISSNKIDKIFKGQEVRIYLEEKSMSKSFPIIGVVSDITKVVNENNHFRVEVKLGKVLKKSNGQKIKYKPGLKARAELTTEDLRLIERFLHGLKNIF